MKQLEIIDRINVDVAVQNDGIDEATESLGQLALNTAYVTQSTRFATQLGYEGFFYRASGKPTKDGRFTCPFIFK